MAAKTKRDRRVKETLAQAVAHPLRVQALSIMVERPATSPKELAAMLDTPVANISYHVRELEKLGLIELVDERRRRGAVEHFYRGVVRPLISDDEWEALSVEERTPISAGIIQLLLTDATRALETGTFVSRADSHLSRTPVAVDEQGWEQLVAIQARALKAILKVEATCAKRLAATGEEGFPVITALACFEMPSPKPGSGAGEGSAG